MEVHRFFPFFCALIYLSEIFHFSIALDTLLETQSMSDGETLVSSGQSFELGFFSPVNSKNRYLGIWYRQTPDTVTWVANRNNPITGSHGFLTVTKTGLVLSNQANSVIWSSNTTKVAESPIAQLLDSGNFVVKDNAMVSSDSSESSLWQSFDYPSNTWLPGMKINDDFNKGLTSWKSLDDPSLGDYTCRIENPELPQVVVGMGSIRMFRTGFWNGLSFSGLLSVSDPYFTLKLVFNKDELEYMYQPETHLVNTRVSLNNSGLLHYYVLNNATTEWAMVYTQPNDVCDSYGKCGANSICGGQKDQLCECLMGFTPTAPAEWELLNWSSGCRRRKPLICQNGDGFLKLSRVKLPDLLEFRLNKTMSTKGCKKECLKNCSCTAYANSNITGKGHGCLMWFGNLVDIKGFNEENRGQDIYIRLPASELERFSHSNTRKRLSVIIVVSVIAGILIVCLILWCITLKKRKNKRGMECKMEDIEVPFYDLETLSAATDGFSPEKLVGAGGFGSVYKGILCTGQDIAVKRLSKNSKQGLEEFKNEVFLIAKLQHRNLVRLLGYCIEGEERILVYEFMANSSLDYFIFDQKRSALLLWKKRFGIIMGIARGLLYLHQDSRLQIIHRDLKTSNVLLDQNLKAVLSDFGLARTFGGDEVQVRTNRVAGTYGYMSPEYAVDGEFSVKSDVFAFGVLILEILSGKKNRGFTHPDHHHNLLGHAWLLWKKDRGLELIDSCLENSCVPSQVLRCIQLGLLCVQKFPEDRPEMSCVVSMLVNEKDKLPDPKQPGFFIERRSNYGDAKSNREESVSNNEVTLTVQGGRREVPASRNMATRRVLPSFCLFVLSCYFLKLFNGTVAATDTLFQGQVMRDSESVRSAGNTFELGFVSPGSSTKRYVGIWMINVPSKDIVWVANRDHPFSGSSQPVLTINDDGYLVIVDSRITYRVSDDPSSQNVSATLLDSGNLVLRNENFDVLWQSFDYPTDTFLPGMKLGYSRKTGKVWSLTSWVDEEDPNIGDFEVRMDRSKSHEVFLMRGSETVWSTGAWEGVRFTSMPEMRLNYIFNYSIYSDENETYFSYALYNPSIITRFIVSVSGQLREFSWLNTSQEWVLFWAQPRALCDVFNSCGPFSSCSKHSGESCQCLRGFYSSERRIGQGQNGGCTRRMALNCGIGDKDRFFRMDGVRYPLSSTEQSKSSYSSPSGPEVSSTDAKACEVACLNNCSCTAYAYNKSGHCLRWFGDILNLQQLSEEDPNGKTIFIKLSASEFDSSGGAKKFWWIIVIAVALVVLLSACYIVFQWRKSLKNKGEADTSQDILLFDMEMSTTSSSEFSGSDKVGKGKRKDAALPLFSFVSISAATENFSLENKLGEGGFGPVYKGKLLNGQEIAVKRLSKRSGQGLEELKNETMLIAKLQHRNLVRLLGCCLEQGEKILIYEFMPNKSLDAFLFDPNNRRLLDWRTRIRIIEGIAQGILYLHQYSRLRIIHRDLKASNILLDSDMNPKISDFGLARMFGGDELQANTNRIVGTYGYMSPEYALEGLFSIKSDVFSFGVLLLEIVSGKKNTGLYHSNSLNLLGHAWELWKGGRALELMDPTLEEQVPYPVLLRYIHVALLCVQEIAADRPTMSEVVSMLTNELTVLNSPNEPAFSSARSAINNPNQHASRPELCSVNNVTVSLMEPR
ncbi:PREDICTED: uncharacterized protein LOC18593792 [Theobroma cacao]|uniref:non-specific serine/threonine protein kinase n=1 Tax=Theobroma cacao TaxID=3641 RepID=A0AB32WPW3_THECC|nr:PREDICTED: uncharacterized protein LOC18593792 [Theobroma cacao]